MKRLRARGIAVRYRRMSFPHRRRSRKPADIGICVVAGRSVVRCVLPTAVIVGCLDVDLRSMIFSAIEVAG